MTTNQLYAVFWALLAFVIIMIAIATNNYYKHKTEQIADMVKHGVSGIEASCAVNDTYGNNPSCMAAIVQDNGR